MEIETALINKLLATTAVTDLVGKKIHYAGDTPKNTTKPYIVIQKISAQRLHAHDGPCGLVNSRIQFSCFASTYLGAKAVCVAIQVALDGSKGVLSGVNVGSCLYDNETDLYDQDYQVCGVEADYMVSYNE